MPKSEERVKPGTEKDTNRAYSTVKRPRILLPQCTLVISFMKTGRLPSQTKVLAGIIKQNVLTSTAEKRPDYVNEANYARYT